LEKLQRRLNGNDLLIVCKPEQDYSLPELYLIDQFLMKGGKILWMIDPIQAEIDSFENNSQIIAMSRELENIESSLFKYGIKLENTLLADALSNAIPIPVGGRPELIDFQYFPVFTSAGLTHPITKNLGLVWSQFASTIQVKGTDSLQVTPLLTSSPNTKIITPPARIDLQSVYMQSKDDNYKNTLRGGTQLSGVMVEGEFLSPFLYQRKFTELPFINRGKSKMIVLADGDIARNATSKKGMIFPTGYDRFTRNTFANKTFLLNCIDYLIDDNGLIEIRAKEKVVRLLDKEKIRQEKSFYQWLNMLAPLLVVLLFGLINGWVRRRKYAKV
jgi:ABC-2 type transport system permease protein